MASATSRVMIIATTRGTMLPSECRRKVVAATVGMSAKRITSSTRPDERGLISPPAKAKGVTTSPAPTVFQVAITRLSTVAGTKCPWSTMYTAKRTAWTRASTTPVRPTSVAVSASGTVNTTPAVTSPSASAVTRSTRWPRTIDPSTTSAGYT